jgi:hypothetical protein
MKVMILVVLLLTLALAGCHERKRPDPCVKLPGSSGTATICK